MFRGVFGMPPEMEDKMKVVILAGGLGTRISEESHLKPKPMIEIGGKPILWHIMKIYSAYGFNEFIICCGYKGQMIKEYFIHYNMYTNTLCVCVCVCVCKHACACMCAHIYLLLCWYLCVDIHAHV